MAITSIGYVIINSTDPGRWREFGTRVLGMMEVECGDDTEVVYLRCDERPFRFAIVPGAENSLRCCGYEVRDSRSFRDLCDLLGEHQIHFEMGTAEEAAMRRVAEFVRLQDPAGNVVELYHGAQLDYQKFVSPLGIAGFETGFNGNMGFGHAVLPAPNLAETHRFYTEVLGFGDTDYMQFGSGRDNEESSMGLHFLHVENPRHHTLALFQAENPAGCIHLMLEVEDIDEVGYCLDRVMQQDIPVTSTLGRHSNDRMLSFYMMTPGGFPLEFGCGGLKMDWDGYTPTVSTTPSIWGHKWGG